MPAQHSQFQASNLELLKHLAGAKSTEPLVEAALGHKALADGDNEVAIGHLTQALSPLEATVYLDLAKAFSALGRQGEVMDALREASDLAPHYLHDSKDADSGKYQVEALPGGTTFDGKVCFTASGGLIYARSAGVDLSR